MKLKPITLLIFDAVGRSSEKTKKQALEKNRVGEYYVAGFSIQQKDDFVSLGNCYIPNESAFGHVQAFPKTNIRKTGKIPYDTCLVTVSNITALRGPLRKGSNDLEIPKTSSKEIFGFFVSETHKKITLAFSIRKKEKGKERYQDLVVIPKKNILNIKSTCSIQASRI